MSYKICYTPEAQRDMDAVWDGVFNASGDFDTADKYVEELIDEISKMKAFPRSGIPLEYNVSASSRHAPTHKCAVKCSHHSSM